jgi:glycosyltransferase involved in cell wall biosynthesis
LDNELVSIIIPTKNSAATLPACIESIRNQDYSSIEIIVVDTNSTDDTVAICESNNVLVLNTDWQTLGSRAIGLSRATGIYVLMMDSDQILESGCIENCIILMKECDMVCLEEKAFNPRTMIQKMYEADRKLIHKNADLQLDPFLGVLAPRFYRKSILEKAFARIPKDILPFATGTEDKIIYYESLQVSNKVKILPNAVGHLEPEGIKQLWRKNYKYGKSDRQLAKTGHYASLLSKKMRLRRSRGLSKNRILSSMLLLLKAPPYLIGFYVG